MSSPRVTARHPRDRRCLRRRAGRLASLVMIAVGLAAVLPVVTAGAIGTAPNLGTATSYGVLAGSTVTNTGSTTINGDLGLHPGTSVTGAPVVTGQTNVNNGAALQAKSDLGIAYTNAAGQACDTNLTGQNLGGKTLVPGVYCFDVAAQLTGTLTLNTLGNPGAVFIFKVGSTLTTAPNSSVVFLNAAPTCNVFWQVGSSATLNTDTAFIGTILASESISALTRTTVQGRLLARTSAVTLDTNTITIPVCAAVVPDPDPTTTTAAPTTTTSTTRPTTTTTSTTAPTTTTTAPAATPTTTDPTGGGTPTTPPGPTPGAPLPDGGLGSPTGVTGPGLGGGTPEGGTGTGGGGGTATTTPAATSTGFGRPGAPGETTSQTATRLPETGLETDLAVAGALLLTAGTCLLGLSSLPRRRGSLIGVTR